MESLLCTIGNRELFMPVNDKLGNLLLKTQRAVNYNKRIAKMRRSYYGEVQEDNIVFSPTFLYAFEDTLAENGYEGAVHILFQNFTLRERKILFMLFREGKSFRYLEKVLQENTENIEELLRSFFTKLIKNII